MWPLCLVLKSFLPGLSFHMSHGWQVVNSSGWWIGVPVTWYCHYTVKLILPSWVYLASFDTLKSVREHMPSLGALEYWLIKQVGSFEYSCWANFVLRHTDDFWSSLLLLFSKLIWEHFYLAFGSYISLLLSLFLIKKKRKMNLKSATNSSFFRCKRDCFESPDLSWRKRKRCLQ